MTLIVQHRVGLNYNQIKNAFNLIMNAFNLIMNAYFLCTELGSCVDEVAADSESSSVLLTNAQQNIS